MKQYDNVFKEQLQAGIIDVSQERESRSNPLFATLPGNSQRYATIKLRVVFDAPAASKGPSNLHQNSLFSRRYMISYVIVIENYKWSSRNSFSL